jgi:multiple sugar transport system substrate-binding protein
MELELSLMGNPAKVTDVQNLLAGFEQRRSLRVKVNYQGWDSAWSGLVRNSIHGSAPTVSEIGTSWVPDLVGMNALYPLPISVIKAVGNESDYVPQSWKSCFLIGDLQMWSLPWISGARVIYYRKDLLAKAELNPDTAFHSPEAMLDSVRQLQKAGITRPWITSTAASLNTFHLISSWIWAAGGDYISEDGRRLLFTEDKAIDGMAAFFALGNHMEPGLQECSYDAAIDMFWRGDAAITMDGGWVYETQKLEANPEVLENLGVALPPGPSYAGGSNLVIWTNTKDKGAAEELLLFMTEPESVMTMARVTGLFPARRSLLNAPEVIGRDFGKVMGQAIDTGRALPSHVFSAMLEDKLRYTFGNIWADVLKSPGGDLREMIAGHLFPLKERLELAIYE